MSTVAYLTVSIHSLRVLEKAIQRMEAIYRPMDLGEVIARIEFSNPAVTIDVIENEEEEYRLRTVENIVNQSLVDSIKQNYSYCEIMEMVEAQGYTLQGEITNRNGEIVIQVTS